MQNTEINNNELRLGNWVSAKQRQYFTESEQKFIRIESIDEEESLNLIIGHDGERDCYITDVEGIPLTPEILINCGFSDTGMRGTIISKETSGPWYELIVECRFDTWGVNVTTHLKFAWINGKLFLNNTPVNVGCVHQFQNIYFAYMNEEIKIDL